MTRFGSTVFAISIISCATPQTRQSALSESSHTGEHGGEDSEDNETPTGDPPPGTDEEADDDPAAADDSLIINTDLPLQLECGETAGGRIVMMNNGWASWSRTEGYKLGAVDDSDPFFGDSARVWLPEGDTIPPGQAWNFQFDLTAPDTPGVYTTDWQMVHEGIEWFGEVHSQEIEVNCDPPTEVSCCAPDESPPPPDLSDTIWLHTDVSGWPETSVLSSVSATDSQICLEYDMADTWPIYDLRGTDVVGNPWIFIWEDGVWYAGTWEWLRPGQTCKNIDSVAGSHIKADPFGEHSGWVPTSGQTYYFMVSGLGRFSERTVEERTNLVPFVWP